MSNAMKPWGSGTGGISLANIRVLGTGTFYFQWTNLSGVISFLNHPEPLSKDTQTTHCWFAHFPRTRSKKWGQSTQANHQKWSHSKRMFSRLTTPRIVKGIQQGVSVINHGKNKFSQNLVSKTKPINYGPQAKISCLLFLKVKFRV